MQFWAILGRVGPFYVPILAKAFFQKHECPILGLQTSRFRFVACPQNMEMHFPKTQMPQKGTSRTRSGRRLHPLKTAKAFFRKHECLKKGHATAPIGAGCTP